MNHFYSTYFDCVTMNFILVRKILLFLVGVYFFSLNALSLSVENSAFKSLIPLEPQSAHFALAPSGILGDSSSVKSVAQFWDSERILQFKQVLAIARRQLGVVKVVEAKLLKSLHQVELGLKLQSESSFLSDHRIQKLKMSSLSVWWGLVEKLRSHYRLQKEHQKYLTLLRRSRRYALAFFDFNSVFTNSKFKYFGKGRVDLGGFDDVLAAYYHGAISLDKAILKIGALSSKQMQQNFSVFSRLAVLRVLQKQKKSFPLPRLAELLEPIALECSHLADDELHIVVVESARIWEHFSDGSSSWRAWPLPRQCYMNSSLAQAMNERMAMADFINQPSQFTAHSLIKAYQGGISKLSLNNKYSQILKVYRYSWENLRIEPGFFNYADQQLSNNQLPKKIHKMLLQEMFLYLVSRLDLMQSKNVQALAIRRLRDQIDVFEKYERSISNKHLKLRLDLARLEAKHRYFKEAVQDFDLVIENVNQSRKYLILKEKVDLIALNCGWNTMNPWRHSKLDCSQYRGQLLRSFYHLAHINQKHDWKIAANIGMLEMTGGRELVTQSYWLQMIQSQPEKKQASEALSVLIRVAESQKRWEDLRNIVEVAIAKNVKLSKLGSERSLPFIHEHTLYQLSLDYYKSSKFREAENIIESILNQYPYSTKRIAYLYLKATIQGRLGESFERVQTLQAILNLPRHEDPSFHDKSLQALVHILTGSGQFVEAQQSVDYYFSKYPASRKSSLLNQFAFTLAVLTHDKQKFLHALKDVSELDLSQNKKSRLKWEKSLQLAQIFGDQQSMVESSKKLLESNTNIEDLDETAIYFLLDRSWTSQDSSGLDIVEDYFYRLPALHKKHKRWSAIVSVTRWAMEMNRVFQVGIRNGGKDLAMYPARMLDFVEQIESSKRVFCTKMSHECRLYLAKKLSLLKSIEEQFKWMRLPKGESHHRTAEFQQKKIMLKKRIEKRKNLVVQTLRSVPFDKNLKQDLYFYPRIAGAGNVLEDLW